GRGIAGRRRILEGDGIGAIQSRLPIRSHAVGKVIGKRGRLRPVIGAGVELQGCGLQAGESQQADRQNQERDQDLHEREPAAVGIGNVQRTCRSVWRHNGAHPQSARVTETRPGALIAMSRPWSSLQFGKRTRSTVPADTEPRAWNCSCDTSPCTVPAPPLRAGQLRSTSPAGTRRTQPLLQSLPPLQSAPFVELQRSRGAPRRVASLRPRFIAVTRSFVSVTARLLSMMLMKPGTPNDRTIAATVIVNSSSSSVNPFCLASMSTAFPLSFALWRRTRRHTADAGSGLP